MKIKSGVVVSLALALVLLATLVNPLLAAPPDRVVAFPDSELNDAIRSVLDNPVGDIHRSDLLTLTSLSSNLLISDLSGIQYCTNLTELTLAQSNIEDLTPLSKLTKLTDLNLFMAVISDISPLRKLTNLESLYLVHNEIRDISALSKLTKLNYVNIADNFVEDLEPLLRNRGLASGDEVVISMNAWEFPTDTPEHTQAMEDINTLISRGVNVVYN